MANDLLVHTHGSRRPNTEFRADNASGVVAETQLRAAGAGIGVR